MGYFKDADEVYSFIGKLFEDLATDDELGPKFRKADTIVQYQYRNPESQITVRVQDGKDGQVDLGETTMEPEVVMTMDADTAHRFWLGKVNVTVALARGPDEGEGPRRQDPQAGAAHEAGLPALPQDARGRGARGPAEGLMDDIQAGEALERRPMSGFKDFFQQRLATRVISGHDLLGSTGFEFQKEGAHRVFVVTDAVVRGTGLVERVEAGVVDGGLEVVGVFDDVPQDSSTHVVDRCAAAAREAGADSFLAVGGGSVIDTAKVACAIFTHGGTAREQEGFFLMPREDDGMGRPLDIAPLACIPTTAGTGSEVSMAAVIKDPEEKVKLEVVDFPLAPRLAILDPESTRTLPASVAAATGMDAMTHAIEGYTCTEWDPYQDARSLQALRLIRDNFERAVERGAEDDDARGNMLVGGIARDHAQPRLRARDVASVRARTSACRTAWRTRSTCRT